MGLFFCFGRMAVFQLCEVSVCLLYLQPSTVIWRPEDHFRNRVHRNLKAFVSKWTRDTCKLWSTSRWCCKLKSSTFFYQSIALQCRWFIASTIMWQQIIQCKIIFCHGMWDFPLKRLKKRNWNQTASFVPSPISLSTRFWNCAWHHFIRDPLKIRYAFKAEIMRLKQRFDEILTRCKKIAGNFW